MNPGGATAIRMTFALTHRLDRRFLRSMAIAGIFPCRLASHQGALKFLGQFQQLFGNRFLFDFAENKFDVFREMVVPWAIGSLIPIGFVGSAHLAPIDK